jgi:hypothetical protein
VETTVHQSLTAEREEHAFKGPPVVTIMNTKDIALSSLFGLVIFVQKMLLPAPYDKVASLLVQITLLSLAFLITGFIGPILSGVISGLLTAMVRGGLAPLTFTFAVLYGVFVSVFNHLMGVTRANQVVRKRLVAASTGATLLVGIVSAVASIASGVLPYNPALIAAIVIAGLVQGVIGGYLSSVIWERYFTLPDESA